MRLTKPPPAATSPRSGSGIGSSSRKPPSRACWMKQGGGPPEMPLEKRNPRHLAGRAGASETVVLGGVDIAENATEPRHLQAAWIRRRFGLMPQRAALVAELAMAGDRKSVVEGKSVSVGVALGGGRIIKKKKE